MRHRTIDGNTPGLADWIHEWLDGSQDATDYRLLTTDSETTIGPHWAASIGQGLSTMKLLRIERGERAVCLYNLWAVLLYVRGTVDYDPTWESAARAMAASAESCPVESDYAFVTTSSGEYPMPSGAVDLDPVGTKQMGIDAGAASEAFLWQTGNSPWQGWIGTCADWWTPEGTRKMREKLRQSG